MSTLIDTEATSVAKQLISARAIGRASTTRVGHNGGVSDTREQHDRCLAHGRWLGRGFCDSLAIRLVTHGRGPAGAAVYELRRNLHHRPLVASDSKRLPAVVALTNSSPIGSVGSSVAAGLTSSIRRSVLAAP